MRTYMSVVLYTYLLHSTARGQGGYVSNMNKVKLAFLMALALVVLIPAGVVWAQGTGEPAGTAVIWDNEALSDAITYKMTGVIQPSPGRAYEGWLVSDDGSVKMSTGIMTVSADGNVDHTYTSPTGENLIGAYDKVVITDEPVPDTDPEPSGVFVYSHAIPSEGMAQIRSLLTNLNGLRLGLDAAIQHADMAAASETLDDLRLNTQRVINVIEGAGGSNSDAASGGGTADGVGVLKRAMDREIASQAVSAASGDPVVAARAALVDVTGKNAEDWAVQARDQALVVLDQGSLFTSKLQLIPLSGFLSNARNGFDSSGDGTIASVAGEGGAAQAYVEAQRMATYTLEPGGLAAPVEDRPFGPGLPIVGDSSVVTAVWAALIGGLVLLGSGGALLARTRRHRTRA